MKIGIDARFYGPYEKGLGRYIEKLIENLEEIDDENQYVIFLGKENYDDYQPRKNNFSKIKAPFSWYTVEEQVKMPQLLNKHNLDLAHFPHFNVPLMYKKPFVVTIHDLIIMHFPTKRATTLGPFKYALKQFGYKRVIHHAIKKSEHIITVSEFSKNDILSFFKIDKDKITVTHESTFGTYEKSVDYDYLKQKFSIQKPYFLYVGNAYPHKNIEMLIDAFHSFTNTPGGKGRSLVLVGKDEYFYERIKEYVVEKKIKDVFFTGYASDDELAGLYMNALAYVFPSLYEGFGLPPLEAMSYGTPVLSSDATCMPEILGDAAHYFDPLDRQSLEKSLALISGDHEMQKKSIHKGFEQVKKFSWKKCAKDTLAVYQKAVK